MTVRLVRDREVRRRRREGEIARGDGGGDARTRTAKDAKRHGSVNCYIYNNNCITLNPPKRVATHSHCITAPA